MLDTLNTESESDLELAEALARIDPTMLAFMSDVRRRYTAQVRSNPIPSPHLYQWTAQGDSWVGVRLGCTPILITRATPAPIRKIRHDRGVIMRTLGDGLGMVVMPGPVQTRPKIIGWGKAIAVPRKRAPLAADGKALRKMGITAPKTPSWRQEVAGWSADYRIERGEPCLFDHCSKVGSKALRGWERAPSW